MGRELKDSKCSPVKFMRYCSLFVEDRWADCEANQCMFFRRTLLKKIIQESTTLGKMKRALAKNIYFDIIANYKYQSLQYFTEQYQ